MVRTQSIHEKRHTSILYRTGNSASHRPGLTARICLIGLVLAGAAGSAAASGPGLAFKTGVQTLDDPFDGDEITRTRFEIELSTAKFLDDHADLALAFGGSSLGSFSETYIEYEDDVLMEDTYKDDLTVLDVRLAARLYPLGDNSEIQPYVGAGVGYFWLHDNWKETYTDTLEDPLYPGEYYTVTDEYEGTETPADGFFSFITAGLTVPIGSQGELIFEFQYDIEKEDDGFDLGGPIFTIGGRFRF